MALQVWSITQKKGLDSQLSKWCPETRQNHSRMQTEGYIHICLDKWTFTRETSETCISLKSMSVPIFKIEKKKKSSKISLFLISGNVYWALKSYSIINFVKDKYITCSAKVNQCHMGCIEHRKRLLQSALCWTDCVITHFLPNKAFSCIVSSPNTKDL